jgi:hypothetical protein
MAKALNTNMSPPAATLNARSSNISVLTNDANTRMKLAFAIMCACRSVNRPPFRPRPSDRVHHSASRLRSRFGRPTRSRPSGDTSVTNPRQHAPAPRAMFGEWTANKPGARLFENECVADCRADSCVTKRAFAGESKHIRPQPSLVCCLALLTAHARDIFGQGLANALTVNLTPHPPIRALTTDTRRNMFLQLVPRTPRLPVALKIS